MYSPDHARDDEHPNRQAPALTAQDIETIDRIFSDDPSSFAPESDRDHAALHLFGLLSTPVAGELNRPSRVDLIAILAARLESTEENAQLSPQDQRALDQYIANSYQVNRVESALRDRAQRCDDLGNMLSTSAASSSLSAADLVNRTLAKIQTQIDQESAAMDLNSARKGSFSMRWSDLVSIAAMILLFASVAMPIMSGMRSSTQKSLCFDNMFASANAFGLYANDNRDMLPMATAGIGPTWMDVGSSPERSNSSNLYTLVRTKAANLDDLACPSNPFAVTGEPDPNAWDWKSLKEISYSYRIMPPGGLKATSVAQPVRVVLMADRSPVVLRVSNGSPIIPEENSPNHQGQGQHMLMLDGASIWTTSPVIHSNDNIWLPRPIEQVIHEVRSRLGIIKGSELPDGPTDAFVGP